MDNKITNEFLREYFSKHDTLTLYKPDGTPFTFTKKGHYEMVGGYSTFVFKDYDQMKAHYKKYNFTTTPVVCIN